MQPDCERDTQRQAQHDCVERPRDPEKGETRGSRQGAAEAGAAANARAGADRERTAQSRHRSAPVAIDPIAEEPEPQHEKQPSGQRPGRRQPALERPTDRGAGERHAEQDSGPRAVGHQLAEAEEDALTGEIHRAVGGALKHVNGFEMPPHGMSGVGQTAVGERVAQQQVAELVGNAGLGNGLDR